MYVILSEKDTEKGKVVEAKYQSDVLDLGSLKEYAPGSVALNVGTGKRYVLSETKEWEEEKLKAAPKPKTASK